MYCVSIGVPWGTSTTACMWWGGDNLKELAFFFYHVSSRVQTQVMRLGSKDHYLPS